MTTKYDIGQNVFVVDKGNRKIEIQEITIKFISISKSGKSNEQDIVFYGESITSLFSETNIFSDRQSVLAEVERLLECKPVNF